MKLTEASFGFNSKYKSPIFTGKQCMVDSGGYTMKCRRVKPNPWEVRRKRTVLGRGHENGSSSVGYCAPGDSAELLHSGDSFCTERNVERANVNGWFYFLFLILRNLKIKSVNAGIAQDNVAKATP